MSFHLYSHGKERQTNQAGWHLRESLSEKAIEQLENPEGDTAERPVRSIPSPFAPLHLTREALLRYVRLEGQVSDADRRTISDMLDIGVLFYDLEARVDHLDCLSFDLGSLKSWKESGAAGARFASALQSFSKVDKADYGFGYVDNLYLLTAPHTPQRVLGGTCPATMFFAAPGDKAWFKSTESFGGDTLFDDKYSLLKDRYEDYVLWLYALRRRLRDEGAPTDLPFCQYLDYVLDKELLRDRKSLADQINAAKNSNASDFDQAYQVLKTTDGSHLRVFNNVELRGVNAVLTSVESDFLMALGTKAGLHDRVPLAVPRQPGGRAMLVNGETFDTAKHLPPFRNPALLHERRLPGLARKYPYLATADFLADDLVEVPYIIDDTRWLSLGALDAEFVRQGHGASDGKGTRDYLLPLTRGFFDYFSAAELLSNDERTPRLEVRIIRGGEVDITLHVPVANSRIASFTRTYKRFASDGNDASAGSIKRLTFGLALFPSYLEDAAGVQAQRILLTYHRKFDDLPAATFLQFLQTDTEGSTKLLTHNNRVDWHVDDAKRAQLSEVGAPFDVVRIADRSHATSSTSGFLLPRSPDRTGAGAAYSFAVDFGTTNTHIEMRSGAEAAHEFSTVGDESVTATLHPFLADANKPGQQINREDFGLGQVVSGTIDNQRYYQTRVDQLLPGRIGPDYPTRFPLRTASIEHDHSIRDGSEAMLHASIPWQYGRFTYDDTVVTNLKWEASAEESVKEKNDHTRAFIRGLCALMRARVVRGGGSLAATKLVWFYPVSMTSNQLGKIEKVWKDAWQDYFPEANAVNLSAMYESLAPAYAWQKFGVKSESRPTVVIDIGGGTTDVTVLQTVGGVERAIKVSSYRVAGNAVFGDGGSHLTQNGFIRRFGQTVQDKALRTGSVLDNVEKEIRKRGRGEDVVSFWLGLVDNRAVEPPFDFARDYLENTHPMRVPFVVFFAALVFRIARDLQAEEIIDPRYLAFSGNGSRMLNYVTRNEEALATFFTTAFALARGQRVDPDADTMVVKHEQEQPKQMTAKGGLEFLANPDDLGKGLRNKLDQTPTPADLTVLASDPNSAVFAELATFADFFEDLVRVYDFPDIGIQRSCFRPAIASLKDRAEVRAMFEAEVKDIKRTTSDGEQTGRHAFFVAFRRLLPHIASELADT